jgi:hypothetical protein
LTRRPGTRGSALIFGFAAMTALGSAAPASAQVTSAPAGAFDGEYTGKAIPSSSDDPDCDLAFDVIMTVAAPQVRVRELVGGRPQVNSSRGTIDPSGRASTNKTMVV